MALSHSPRIVTDGLVFCVDAADKKSYAGSGSTWTDRSGNGYNGTIYNATYNSSDKCFVFDGADDYVQITDSDSLSFTDARFSIECMFYYAQRNERDNVLIGKRDYGATQREYNLYIYQDTVSSEPHVRLIISSNLTPNWTILESSDISFNTWYHVIATSDSGTCKIYMNGELDSTSTSMHSSTMNGTSPLTIGNAYNSGSILQELNGKINFARIYNKALTADEVLQNFQATRGRFVI